MPSPKMATSSGSPAATIEPKAMSRMSAAAARPIISGGVPSSAFLIRLPPSLIERPLPEAFSASSISCLPEDESMSVAGRSSSSWTSPIVPSRE